MIMKGMLVGAGLAHGLLSQVVLAVLAPDLVSCSTSTLDKGR